MHVGDLLHAQPAELTGTHSAVHAVAAAVVGLHDVGPAAGARFDLLCIFSNRVGASSIPTCLLSKPETKKTSPHSATKRETHTSTGFFIEDIQRGGVVAARRVARPLAPGLVARLIGVPQLPTVIAELCATALAATAQLGTLGAAVSDHGVAGEQRHGRTKPLH